jgi:hypothetical protein
VIVGGVHGKFKEVFQKISALHAKNAFALAIVAGDLFSDPQEATADDEANVDDLLSGKVTIPLPTYFALGKHSLPLKVITKLEDNENEICENLHYLGKRTTIKTSEGIRIVALGGTLDTNLTVGTSKDNFTPFYSGGDASALKGANTCDILITSEWPHGITTGSKVLTQTDDTPPAHHILSELTSTLKPRYHFSTSSFFYEREPFFHPPTDSSDANATYSTTRFLSLAPFGNAKKAKWIYAFTLDPNAAPSVVIPPGTTASPFAFGGGKKRPLPDQAASFSRFAPHSQSVGRPSKKGRRNEPRPGPDNCFFCLSSPTLATHLIASIGTDAYLTTAKGPLSTKDTFSRISPSLSFPAHILIIPLAHAATLGAVPEVEARMATFKEMRRYRNALNSVVLEAAKGRLGSVCWEVSRSEGIHTHWQWVPLQREMIEKGLVEVAVKVESENEGWSEHVKWEKVVLDKGTNTKKEDDGTVKEEVEEEDGGVSLKTDDTSTTDEASLTKELAILTDRTDCFRIWTWLPPTSPSTAGTTTLLTLPLTSAFRFDLQFGRRVLAKLLGLEKRFNWRDCAQSEEEETKEAEDFKKVFEKFDFSLSE